MVVYEGRPIVIINSPKTQWLNIIQKIYFTPVGIWPAAFHTVIQGPRLLLVQQCDFLRYTFRVFHWIRYIQLSVERIKIFREVSKGY